MKSKYTVWLYRNSILEVGIQKIRNGWCGAVGVWVRVTLELSGCDKLVGTMLCNSMVSAIWWDEYKPLDVATGSGCNCVVSKVWTGVTTLDEWHTCILESGLMYPFWKVTTVMR